MKKNKFFLILAGIGLFAYSWINTFIDNISFGVVGVKKKSIDLKGVVLDILFKINNNNTTSFNIINIKGYIFYQNINLGAFYLNTPYHIAEKSATILPISIGITWAQIISDAATVIQAFNKDSIILDFKGEYTVSLFGHSKVINYTYSQTIQLK